jgi:glycosyltransferase involved in cell wall biosynthesis
MPESKKFSILIFTYNRNEMLSQCIASLQSQTYKNFECVVLDRGSNISLETFINSLNDTRFRFVQSSQDIDRVDSGNEIIKNMKGDYFLNPGDDDILLPKALEFVKKAFDKEEDCDVVQIGMVKYKSNLNEQEISNRWINGFSTPDFYDNNMLTLNYDGKMLAKHAFGFARIGCGGGIVAAHSHPSAVFIKKSAIDKIWDAQKGLFVKTFWDGGYMAVAWRSQICYINMPLAIYSILHQARETETPRIRWAKECSENEHINLKAAHALNCGADGILKTIYRTGIYKEYNTYIRFQFYTDILKDVIKDKRKDLQTRQDLMELLLQILKYPFCNPKLTIIQIYNAIVDFFVDFKNIPKKFESAFIHPCVIFVRRILGIKKKRRLQTAYFENILEYGNFIENTFTEKAILLDKYLSNKN